MERFVAIALVVVGLALPVSAQRGGGRAGPVGHRTAGFSGGAHEAFAPSTRYSLGGAPQFSAGRAVAPAPAFRFAAARRPGSPGGIYRRPVYAVGVPYGVGWVTGPGFYDGSGDPGYSDPGSSDPGYSDAAMRANYPAQPEYPPQGNYPAPAYAGPLNPGPPAPGDGYRPAFTAPAAPEPENLDTVTLVFKDGRPSQQIHNYLLTRTTLYVRDRQRREIPVDELDLAATQNINRAAGVEFQLPGQTSSRKSAN